MFGLGGKKAVTDEATVREKIAGWQDPLLESDLLSLEAVKAVACKGDSVKVEVALGLPVKSHASVVEAGLQEAIQQIEGVNKVEVNVEADVISHAVQSNLAPLQGIKNIIAVASGKGGVGKSTTSVNLALALQKEGANVGLLDADIYGPSQQRMMGLEGKPESTDGKTVEPMENYGVQTMSIGCLVEEDTPMIWRGPMVTQALSQMLNDTNWNDLDYLIIDLPPGTGDIQLTLCQKIPVSGAVIVTTPQDIALLDARKALKMFEKVSVPVLGVVENMSTHVCSNCGHEEHIFGEGGGEWMAEKYEVNMLGSLPLHIDIRMEADDGKPTVVAQPESDLTKRYTDIALKTAASLAKAAKNTTKVFPEIKITET